MSGAFGCPEEASNDGADHCTLDCCADADGDGAIGGEKEEKYFLWISVFSIACFTERFFLATLLKGISGGVTEWFKVAVLKTAVPERVP